MKIESLLYDAQVIFWDFDGVIKESDEIKTKIYFDLFSRFGHEFATKVKEHHILHAGISRFVKIPLYLGWAIEKIDEDLINSFYTKFSDLSIDLVIRSPWVPGVYEYLTINHTRQNFILLTGTPHEEMIKIIEKLNIFQFFNKIYGAPFIKSETIKYLLEKDEINANNCIFVGDSLLDYEAASQNNVPFVLRETILNSKFLMANKIASFTSLEIKDE